MSAVSFDRVAPYYDFLAEAIFGKAIVKAQTCFLDHLLEGSHLLILGGGTGWIIREILQRKKVQQIDYVEASARMITLAQHQYQRFRQNQPTTCYPKINFIQGTESNLPSDTVYDAVMTFFVLDMQQQEALHEMMEKIHRQLHPQGLWFFADFKIPENERKRWWHLPLVKLMYCFFRLTAHLQNHRLPDYESSFSRLNVSRERVAYFYQDLITSELYRKI